MAASQPAHGRIEKELERIYAHRFTDQDRARKETFWRTICASFFPRYVPPDSVVADLGAGYCEFINHVRARRRFAVDLNPETARLAAPGVEVLSIPLEGLADALEPDSIDVAFASNVFEHLRGPDVLLEILESVRTVLRPGGRLILLQPNVAALGGRFWDYLDHTLPLSERGMVEALDVSGFEVLECRARFLPYTFKSRLPTWSWLVRLYLALPPAQWAFGRQMFVVGRRPL